MSDGVRAGKGMQLSDLDLDVLEQLLSEEGVEGSVHEQPIRPRSASERVPLSFSQELLWLLDQASPGLTAYNLALSRRLVGPLDVAALERAINAMSARHELLRTRFAVVDGEPSQIVDPPSPVRFNFVDLSGQPADERDAELGRMLRARAQAPFDMAAEHLFRVTLARLTETDHVFLIETHHAICDGWSVGLIMREIAELYRADLAGATPNVPLLAIQFGDYAIWQRATLAGDRLAGLLDFWRRQLGDAKEPLDLPTDFPAPTTPSYAGASVGASLSPELLASIKAVGREHDATVYMTLLAAYATVLHRYTGREHVLIGSGVAGRSQHAIEPVIGYFNNTVVQRVDFDGDPTLAELLARVRDSALGAFDHQEVPLEKLILELRDAHERVSDAPLFQAVFTMQDPIGAALEIAGLQIQPFGVELGSTKFDITLLPSERDGGLRLTVHYRSDLFTAATMDRFLGHLHSALEAIVADTRLRVSEVPLLTAPERQQLAGWNATAVDEGSPATLVGLFEAQAERVPGRPAVVAPRASATAAGSVAGAMVLTYAELNARANQLARDLQAKGVGANVPVGLLLDRSADALVGLMGILKAGGAYVPLAVEAPAARLAQQIAASGARIVVTSGALADRLPPTVGTVALDRGADAARLGTLSDANLALVAGPSDIAYVLHTSGSTGAPKGVAVTHANAVHYTRAVSRVLADTPASQPGDGLAALDGWRFGLASTLAADLGNTSLFPAFLAGGTLHVLSKEVTMEPARYGEYVAVHRFDVLKITPTHLQALVAGRRGHELATVLPARWLVTGGEALRPDVARAFLSGGAVRVLNHYGPTETTVGVCTFEATEASLAAAEALGAQTVPIGRPLANTCVHVVDANGREQPVGIPGELWVGGAGVAQGYLDRVDLTAERFVEFDGARVYRTGDRVRRLPDGTIEFLGRADEQVKVRGYRVELGEIEQALCANPGVESAIVVLRDEAGAPNDGGAEPRLVAYVVPKAAGYAVSHADRPTSEKLVAWMGASLPEYMVPSTVVLLDALPLTPNGKIDRRALPAPDAVAAPEAAFVEPSTETQRKLAAIWSEVLKKERVGLTDNFLDLGGHSLMAIRVLGKISKGFGVRLPIRTLFDSPTIQQLAEVLDLEMQLAALEGMSDEEAAQLLGSLEPNDGPERTT
jgi:amino acid adenylation domain-containing protein